MTPNSDKLLRPQNLNAFVGQEAIKTQLRTVIQAAKAQDKTTIGHVLLYGPAGTGKTSLAYIISNELGVPCWATTGTNLAVQLSDYGNLYSMGAAIEQHGVIFCDEIHRVANLAQDTLLPFLEERKLAVKYRAPSSEWGKRKGDWITLNCTMKEFTFIGASTRPGLLQQPFRERFKLELELSYYDAESLFQIASRSAQLLELSISDAALHIIARRSKGVPRLTNRNLWYCRQYQIANGHHYIDTHEVQQIMRELSIDTLGLDESDRNLLSYLAELNGPAGANTLCAYLSIDRATLETMLEPPLLRSRLIVKTARGRTITPKALEHLKNPFNNSDDL